MTDKPARKRLPPEIRKQQILDEAATLIRERGVSALNMDLLARVAGISKPLVYNYFNNRTELLKTLLLREVKLNRARNREVAATANSMEELVRVTSRSMLEYVEQRGIIIQQLMLEPEVAEVLQELQSKSHRHYVQYLAQRLRTEYNIPQDLSEAVIDLALGLSSAAGSYVERTKDDIKFVEDILVTMIMGSLNAVAAENEAGTLTRKSRRTTKRLQAAE